MVKAVPDNTMDAELDYINGSNRIIACSAQPATYAEATGTYDLATGTISGADFTKADDTSGRKTTFGGKAGVTIDHTGDATHIALVNTGDTTLRLVTTCTLQTLTAAGTVDFGSFKHNLQDPT